MGAGTTLIWTLTANQDKETRINCFSRSKISKPEYTKQKQRTLKKEKIIVIYMTEEQNIGC